ncbi:MAG: hypothetical protein ACOY5B_10505 [Spirochaetota bacterium]
MSAWLYVSGACKRGMSMFGATFFVFILPFCSVFGMRSVGISSACPNAPENMFEQYKRYQYRIRIDSQIAVPFARIIDKDTSVSWCLQTDTESIQVRDEMIGVRIPLAMDQGRPDYDWRTHNKLPVIQPVLLDTGFMMAGPVAFLREILESGRCIYAALHFDLKYFTHVSNRLFLVVEGAVGSYDAKPNTRVNLFRETYGALLFDYRIHSYKRVELHWAAGGGLTFERYNLEGASIENYTSQLKTGAILRLNIAAALSLGSFLFYRFNPDKVVYDSRLLYGISIGVKF